MNFKKNIAVVLSSVMALSAQITTPAFAVSEEGTDINAVNATESTETVAVEDEVKPESVAKLPRVTLEYTGVEVVDATEETI